MIERGSSSGFSLVEMLISMALLGLLMVGVLPLFTASMANNLEGQQSTEVTEQARMRIEELMALPIEAPALRVPDGEQELVITELYSATGRRWLDQASFPAGRRARFGRITRVRQYGMGALGDGDFELEEDEALPGGTPPAFVHFKEIIVRVTTGPPTFFGLMGRRKSVTLRVLKST